MTSYVAIADSEIDPESPGTTTLFTKLRDNPIAITEKASGAPVLANDYVVTAMIADANVTTTKIADANVTTTKLESGERMTNTNVRTATASSSSGAAGTYAFLINNTGAAITTGQTVSAASGLQYSDTAANPASGSTPSGTWRCMGICGTSEASLFLRVS